MFSLVHQTFQVVIIMVLIGIDFCDVFLRFLRMITV